MAVDHHVFVRPGALPDPQAWAAAIRDAGFDLAIGTDFAWDDVEGVLPCRYGKAEGGFELSVETLDATRVDDTLANVIGDRNVVVTFTTRSSSIDLACAQIAAAILCHRYDGMLSDGGDPPFVASDGALAWAREAQAAADAAIAAEIRRKKKRTRPRKAEHVRAGEAPVDALERWLSNLAGEAAAAATHHAFTDTVHVRFDGPDDTMIIAIARWRVTLGERTYDVTALPEARSLTEQQDMTLAAMKLVELFRSGPVVRAAIDRDTLALRFELAQGKVEIAAAARDRGLAIDPQYRSPEARALAAYAITNRNRWEVRWRDAGIRVRPDDALSGLELA